MARTVQAKKPAKTTKLVLERQTLAKIEEAILGDVNVKKALKVKPMRCSSLFMDCHGRYDTN